ncbi:MAG: YqhA family protein [Candidatus Contendobacter sp.]|nr:YqhA family protein [Candidatus Contendobacter sp.]
MKKLQDLIEQAFFSSRWLLAPMYAGLVLALVLLLVKFGLMFGHALHETIGANPSDPSKLVLAILHLVDLTLVGGLVLIIVFSGYENFVSKIDCAEGHKDRPSWMGTINYGGLKLKIIGSVVAISIIHLLTDFMGVGNSAAITLAHAQRLMESATGTDEMLKAAEAYAQMSAALNTAESHKLIWKVGLHMAFVVSGVMFAIMEKISHSANSHGPSAGDTVSETATGGNGKHGY